VSVSAARSTDPDSPPRKVDAAVEKKLRDLEGEGDRLLEKGKFAEAVGPATEAAELTAKVYGQKDWRVFDAARRLKLAEIGKELPVDKRKQLTDALRAEAEAKGLEVSKPMDALKRALTATEGYTVALGDKSPECARAWHLVGRLR